VGRSINSAHTIPMSEEKDISNESLLLLCVLDVAHVPKQHFFQGV